MSLITANKCAFLSLLLFLNFAAALPSLLHRQVEPVQGCANTEPWHWSTHQTSQSDCTSAATQLCQQIPSESWTVHGWTTVNSGSCRAMVYHTDKMPVPTIDECMQTLSAVISACITQQPNTNDGGFVNQSSDPNKVEDDDTKSVYQIGAGGYFDKIIQWNDSYLVGSVIQEGQATAHA